MDSLIRRLDPNIGCTKAACPPSQSVYGYQPSLPATLIFLILFSISGAVYAYQGFRTRSHFFTGTMLLGCLSEILGYVAKMLLWNDPFSDAGFKMSVVLLTFAPAFYAAGVYYTLKHICITFSAEFSRLRPQLYTYIFISCDVFSILLRAAGGALASAAEDMALLRVGDNVMITGLATQVFTLVVFGILAADYGLAVYRNRQQLNTATEEIRNSLRFKLFLGALWVAYFAILIRCTYRVAELAKGWGPQNDILRTQGLFIGLDSVPCGIASVTLNIWHPGFCFPKETQHAVQEKAAEAGDSSDASSRV